MASNALEDYKLKVEARVINEGIRLLKEGVEEGVIETGEEFLSVTRAIAGMGTDRGVTRKPVNRIFLGILARIGQAEVGRKMKDFRQGDVVRGLAALLEEEEG